MSQPHRITVLCPAKVNLGLEVLHRRPDGYHDICTVMQAIDLYDELTVEVDGGTGDIARGNSSTDSGWATDEGVRATGEIEAPEIELAGPFAGEVPAEGNSVLTAWAVAGGVSLPQTRVRLDKRIPAGAGLGGGSSDAAGMLMAMREVERIHHHENDPMAAASCRRDPEHEDGGWKPPPQDSNELVQQALRLGSDVPFFLQGGCQFTQGRGEQLTPIDRQLDFHLLLAVPCFSSATAQAYAALRRSGQQRTPMVVSWLARGLRDGDWDAVAASLVNDFTPYLLAAHPEYRRWFDALEDSGAAAVSHTGSGSGFYGLFSDAEAATRAQSELAARGTFRYLGVHRPIRF